MRAAKYVQVYKGSHALKTCSGEKDTTHQWHQNWSKCVLVLCRRVPRVADCVILAHRDEDLQAIAGTTLPNFTIKLPKGQWAREG